MKIFNFKNPIFLALVLGIILACNSLSPATPQPAATLNALYTSAAETLGAMSTQGAAVLTSQPSPTGTLSIPTSSPVALQLFTVVPPSAKCDAASFVADVTYPDGSNVGPGVSFSKIWRIKNIGTCTWTTSYALVYITGEKFGAQTSVSLPGRVLPGQSVDLPIQLTAPEQVGRFRGYWKIRNASGVLFGVGDSGDASIYVDVNVSGYIVLGYSFLANYCDASWRNDSQNLACPGTDGDQKGFAIVVDSPKMEDGKTQNKGLITHPQMVKDGVIIGKYPGITVQSGDHFQAVINCLYSANDCDMIFKLQYQIDNGAIQTLGQWREVYEGESYPINIDLSALSGQKVKFILSVLANGSAHEDYALWIAPRITRLSSQPPTEAPTATRKPKKTATPTGTPSPTPTSTATPTATP